MHPLAFANQLTLRGGICGSATKAAPLSPKSARQTRSRSPLLRRLAASSDRRMLCAVAVTIDSIM
jgi:hypothetical protein